MQRAWEIFRLLWATAVAAVCAAAVSAANCVKLRVDGERTFYLYSASSQAEIRTEAGLFDLPFLKGESVLIAAERTEQPTDLTARRAAAVEEVEKRGGVVVLEEWSCGVCSLYCQMPESLGLYDGVAVSGFSVNLHIALSETRTVAGSPIIFGGY